MQEIINAMLKVILDDWSQAKPMHNSVRRWNDMFVEFHSWYTFYFNEDYIEIINSEKNIKERVRRAPNAKISVGVLRALKDWLNLDFNSWITIEDETEEGNNTAWQEWGWEENTEASGNETKTKTEENEKANGAETKKPNRPAPSWANVKK